MIKFLYKMETTAIGKSFKQNQIKSRKYFSAHQYQNFRKFQHQTSTMEQNKETKKKSLGRDTLRISVVARCTVKTFP